MKATCQYFGKCSGCTLQQFPYEKQLYDKNRRVRTELGRFVPAGKDENQVIAPIVASPLPFGYRTSSKLCLNEDNFGHRTIGLYERKRKNVIDIPQCPVHHPEINKLVARLFSNRANALPFYNHAKRGFQPGRLKFVTVRYSVETHTFGVVVSHTGVERPALEQWAAKLHLENVCLFESKLVKEDEDLVLSRNVRYLGGTQDFPFAINGRVFRLDPLAFFQANHALVDLFIEKITEGLEGNTLVDLYGGYGSYSFAAVSRFNKVLLVEANKNAIEAAKVMVKETGLKVVQPLCESVESFLKRVPTVKDREAITHIIVNPPRTGLSAHVRNGLSQGHFPKLQELRYVSCDMETLSRDLFDLTNKGGFKVASITPFDMFPQTEHIEFVVRLIPEVSPAQKKVSALKKISPREVGG